MEPSIKVNTYPVEKVDVKDTSGAGDTFSSRFSIRIYQPTLLKEKF